MRVRAEYFLSVFVPESPEYSVLPPSSVESKHFGFFLCPQHPEEGRDSPGLYVLCIEDQIPTPAVPRQGQTLSHPSVRDRRTHESQSRTFLKKY